MSEGLMSIDFNDQSIRSSKVDRFKVTTKDQVDRIGFPLEGKKSVMGKIHYIESFSNGKTVKGNYLCFGGECCKRLGDPKIKIGTVIVKYGTNANGNVIGGKNPDGSPQFNWSIMHLIYNKDQYITFRNTNEEYPLSDHDLKIICKDPSNFQKYEISPCKQALWKCTPAYEREIVEAAEEALKSISLGWKMDRAKFNELMGASDNSAGVEDASGGSSLESMLADLDS